MEKNYHLAIETPCEKKNWEDMALLDSDRFCTVCARTVIDFTTWNEQELINYFSSQKEPVCGRLNTNQVRSITQTQSSPPRSYWHKFVASVLFIAATNSTGATEIPNSINLTYLQPIKSNQHDKSANIRQQNILVDSTRYRIKGKVVEKSSRQPVANEAVVIVGTKAFANTDSLGNFELFIPADFTLNEITLQLMGQHGFETPTQVTLLKTDLPIENLIIEKKDILIGEVMYKVVKKPWWKFWKW